MRTAGTTYLMYRGRHAHEISKDFALTRAASPLFKRSTLGPRELFYADIFASRKTGCWSRMGMPGMRDQHTGCVGAYLVEHDLFDFLLLSLPDNDTHSHKYGPHAQIDSIAQADAELWRLMEAGGGADAFLDEHAMIVVADHSHSHVERTIDLTETFADWRILQPSGARAATPRSRCARRSARRWSTSCWSRARARCRGSSPPRGRSRASTSSCGATPTGARRSPASAASCPSRPATRSPTSAAGAGASTASSTRCGRRSSDGVLSCDHYPDALARVWAALTCPTSGDVLLSAEPAYEFPDWGGRAHVRGGSHGSLHRVDSLGALLFCGVEAPPERADGCWSIADIAPMVLAHFGAG